MLELLNSALGKTLLLTSRVILGIFFKIAVLSRLCNGLCDSRTLYPFKAL